MVIIIIIVYQDKARRLFSRACPWLGSIERSKVPSFQLLLLICLKNITQKWTKRIELDVAG